MEWLKKFRNSALLLTILGGFITVFAAILMILDLTAGRPPSFIAMTEIGMGFTMLAAGIVGIVVYKKQKNIIICLLIGIVALLAAASNVAFSLTVNRPISPFGWFTVAYPVVIMFYVLEAHKLIKSNSSK